MSGGGPTKSHNVPLHIEYNIVYRHYMPQSCKLRCFKITTPQCLQIGLIYNISCSTYRCLYIGCVKGLIRHHAVHSITA